MTTRIGLLAAIISVSALGLGGCGDDDSVSQSEANRQAREAAREARQDALTEAEVDDLREKIEELEQGSASTAPAPADSGSSSTGVPSDATNCGSGVYARASTTSCPFAQEVARTYTPTGSFEAYSPTTGQVYTMSCSGVDPVICTGGDNAAVYLSLD